MSNKTWTVCIGQLTGTIEAPDHIEAATLFIEHLTQHESKFGVGILMEVTNNVTQKKYRVRSDLILANAGMHSAAASITKLYTTPLN